jgi:hypothetical protein
VIFQAFTNPLCQRARKLKRSFVVKRLQDLLILASILLQALIGDQTPERRLGNKSLTFPSAGCSTTSSHFYALLRSSLQCPSRYTLELHRQSRVAALHHSPFDHVMSLSSRLLAMLSQIIILTLQPAFIAQRCPQCFLLLIIKQTKDFTSQSVEMFSMLQS